MGHTVRQLKTVCRFSLVVNAGGSSRRMGCSKALLSTPPDDLPLAVAIAERMRVLQPQEIIVVANDPAVEALFRGRAEVTVLPDLIPNGGPLGGLLTVLEWSASRVQSTWLAVVACDLPLIDPNVWHYMLGQATDDWDAVVPRVDGRFQPMHALYHSRCLSAVHSTFHAETTNQRRLRMTSLFEQIRVRIIDEIEYLRLDPERHSIVNVNTPEEWVLARSVLRQRATDSA